MNILISFCAFIDKLNRKLGVVLSLIYYLLTVIICYEVVLRYFFNNPTVWSTELSCMIFGASYLFGGGYLLGGGYHVNVDIIYRRFSPRKRAIIDSVTFLGTLSFILVLLIQGASMAKESLKMLEYSSTVWGPPLYPIKLVIPLGAALLLLQALVKFISDFYMAIKGRSFR